MCSGEGDPTSLGPGFPIRTSSDHSSVDSSPRLIAASYVLHRLLVPRHPPCALTNLATKMLASTVQFSNNTRETPAHTATLTEPPKGDQQMCTAAGARNQETHSVCSLRTQQCTDAHHPHQTTQGPAETTRCASVPPMSEPRAERTPANGATSCTQAHHPFPAPNPPEGENQKRLVLDAVSTDRRCELLRKEVIQPHLPVRLPCYDFVPIADPTFDSSLHKGWATGFGCYRLS